MPTPVRWIPLVAAVACHPVAGTIVEPPAGDHRPSASTAGSPTTLPVATASSTWRGGAPTGSTPTPPTPAKPSACSAPSLILDDARDARAAADLSHCRFDQTGHDNIGDRCGSNAFPHPVTLARLDEAVLAVDTATAARVSAIAAEGRRRGKQPRAFALVGDSITASPKFLRPFSRGGQLDPAVRTQLGIDVGGTIVDWYRAATIHPAGNAFAAPRAAKIGAQSHWALPARGGPSPLTEVVRMLSPSVAIVMFGSNDATARFTPLDTLIADFQHRMRRIAEALIAEGVVVVLNTIPRHTHDPSRPACDSRPGDLSNWRLAVQTSALSAAAAELACELSLPLIDLRHALDAILNHGIGPDGVHPNAHPRGAGLLTAAGLQCGYNVRNYVTLRMLSQLQPYITP